MGLEDYRVLLKPKARKSVFPDDAANGTLTTRGSGFARRPTTAELIRALEQMGFVRQAPTRQVGPALLAAPPPGETRLTARHELPHTAQETGENGEYIVEALIRTHEEGKSGDTLFDSLSMRFAICQPEGAAWHFLKLVKRMCDSLSLAVVHGEKTYSPEVFWAFRLRANEQIRKQRILWRQIFEDDSNEPTIEVEETWGHFLKKHALLMAASDKARSHASASQRAPRRAEAQAAGTDGFVGVDMEATMRPRAPRPVPVRRNEKA